MDYQRIDRRRFFARLGGAAAVSAMAPSALADELENELMQSAGSSAQAQAPAPKKRRAVRRGAGGIFNVERNPELAELPKQPTLVDFFERRFGDGIVKHCLRSAQHALDDGQDEIHVMAALVHDTVLSLMSADHGYWGADLLAPYVDEKVSWGIRYHQAARFFPDESVGYEYPEIYVRMFGEDFEPEDYVKHDYRMAREHRWYMHARMITVNDTYGFDDTVNPELDTFVDIIGRNFRQPKEGLGYDGSPSAHMWRTLINPDRPL